MANDVPTGLISTCLSLGGANFSPELFSQVAGQSPTKVWRAKPEILKQAPQIHELEWILELEHRPHWSVDDAIRELLALFADRQEPIVEFAKQHRCHLHVSCRLFGDASTIVYQIERSTLERLAALGCSFSFSVEQKPRKS